MKYVKYMETELGKIGIIEENNYIVKISIGEEKEQGIEQKDTPLLLNATTQIKEYLENKRKNFELPLNPKGTEFMKKVWNELLKIPYGQTRTYKQIAEAIGNKKAARAVGMANNKNPMPIIIPCHRVVGANGSLVGYALGLDMKKYLLKLEKIY